MFVFYFIFGVMLVAFVYAKFCVYSEISELNKYIKEIDPKNVLWGMKKTQSFTIENTHFVQSHASYSMDIFQYSFKKLMILFGAKTSFFSYVIQLSYKKALVEIFEKNFVCDHILINNVEFKRDESRTVTCVLTGVAIRMYQETLPLFNFVPNFNPAIQKVEHRHNFSHLVNGVSVLAITFVMFFGYLTNMATELAKNATIEEHKALWSYLHFPVDRNLHEGAEYKIAQVRINQLLNLIEKPEELKDFEFKVHIIDDSEDIDMVLLPAGNIVITSAMVERFDTENEIVFVLANALHHYKNNKVLTALGRNFLSMHWIASHLGEDSLIGRIFVFYRDFENISYGSIEEYEADEFAVDELYRIYDHVGGLDSLRLKTEQYVKDGDHTYFNKHEYNQERLDRILKIVEEKGYTYDMQDSVSFRITRKVVTSEVINVSPTNRTPIDEFNDTFKLFRSELGGLQNSYYTEFAKLDGILILNKTSTKEELLARVTQIETIGINLTQFDKVFSDLFKKYNDKIESIIESIPDKSNRALSKAIWDKELKTSIENSNLTLKRDKNVINAQKAILKYLISRHGSYTFDGGNIRFMTEKERSDYQDLNDNLNAIIKQVP